MGMYLHCESIPVIAPKENAPTPKIGHGLAGAQAGRPRPKAFYPWTEQGPCLRRVHQSQRCWVTNTALPTECSLALKTADEAKASWDRGDMWTDKGW